MLVEILNAITWPVAILILGLVRMFISVVNKRADAAEKSAAAKVAAEHKEKVVSTIRDAFLASNKIAEEKAKCSGAKCGSPE